MILFWSNFLQNVEHPRIWVSDWVFASLSSIPSTGRQGVKSVEEERFQLYALVSSRSKKLNEQKYEQSDVKRRYRQTSKATSSHTADQGNLFSWASSNRVD